MKKLMILCFSCFILCIATVIHQLDISPRTTSASALLAHTIPQRMISLAPSITDICVLLGLEKTLCGITEQCGVENQAIPSIGGYISPSYDKIIQLQPDLVMLLPEHHAIKYTLGSLGLPVLELDHRTMKGIIGSILVIGKRCGKAAYSRCAAHTLSQRIGRIIQKKQGQLRPSVLITIARDPSDTTFRTITISGNNAFYRTIIECAGGKNAADTLTQAIPFPQVSIATIIALNPDIIIELLPGIPNNPALVTNMRHSWNQWQNISAVKQHRIEVINEPYTLIPGPGFITLMERCAALINAHSAQGGTA